MPVVPSLLSPIPDSTEQVPSSTNDQVPEHQDHNEQTCSLNPAREPDDLEVAGRQVDQEQRAQADHGDRVAPDGHAVLRVLMPWREEQAAAEDHEHQDDDSYREARQPGVQRHDLGEVTA